MAIAIEPRHVTATELRIHLGQLLQAVDGEAQTLIVERNGRALAALIPMSEYVRLHRPQLSEEWWRRQQAIGDEVARNLAGRPFPDVRELIDAGRD